jgi:hypothetical protein
VCGVCVVCVCVCVCVNASARVSVCACTGSVETSTDCPKYHYTNFYLQKHI